MLWYQKNHTSLHCKITQPRSKWYIFNLVSLAIFSPPFNLFKKSGLLQLKFGVIGVNIYLWARYLDKFFHASSSNLLCMLLINSSRTSSIMAKKIQNGRFIAIFRIYVNNLTLWNISSSNLVCMLLISSSRRSSKMSEKNVKMTDLVRFVAFYVNDMTLWAR